MYAQYHKSSTSYIEEYSQSVNYVKNNDCHRAEGLTLPARLSPIDLIKLEPFLSNPLCHSTFDRMAVNFFLPRSILPASHRSVFIVDLTRQASCCWIELAVKTARKLYLCISNANDMNLPFRMCVRTYVGTIYFVYQNSIEFFHVLR